MDHSLYCQSPYLITELASILPSNSLLLDSSTPRLLASIPWQRRLGRRIDDLQRAVEGLVAVGEGDVVAETGGDEETPLYPGSLEGAQELPVGSGGVAVVDDVAVDEDDLERRPLAVDAKR